MKAVLTGASGGMGKEIFKAMSQQGIDVACCCRRAPRDLSDLISQYNALGREHLWVELDLEQDSSISQCLESIEQWSGKRVDVLINCAGMPFGGLINMTKIDDLRRVFQVNYFGPIMLTQRVSRYMARNGGGRIVNIVSTAGIRTDQGTLSYGGSKAALIHATGVMAAEYAPQNIQVNAVAPSLTDTVMADQMDAKAKSRLLELTRIGRMIKVEEVVDMVMFLIGDAPASLSGEVIRLDGCMAL